MRYSARIEMLKTSWQQCRDEADAIGDANQELVERALRLQARVIRLDAEADRLLREYGLDPDDLPSLESIR